MGECCLSRRRRSCDQNKFNIRAVCDLLGNLSDLPLLMRFLYQNHFPHIGFCNHVIQSTYCVDFLKISPLHSLFSDLEELLFRIKCRHCFRALLLRHLDHDTLIIRIQCEIFQASRLRDHIAIIIVFKLIDAVQIHLGNPAVFKQPFLIIHAIFMEQIPCLIRIYRTFFNRKIQFHKFPHSFCHLV